uniref:Uncharacterized protein n=1 Tax=Astyanax mexicanus TaxID=7994 RepID=A0A8B9GRX1_ASTMX
MSLILLFSTIEESMISTLVVRVSSQTGEGVPELWEVMLQFRDSMLACGELQVRRREQQKVWLWSLIQENALQHFREHPAVQAGLPEMERRVTQGDISPGLAADLLLRAFRSSQ